MLDKIVAYKKEEVKARESKNPKIDMGHLTPIRPFLKALQEKKPAVIAEIKKASPSKGLISKKFNVEQTAIAYEKAGACCLSVLTDEHFFQGHDNNLKIAKKASRLPILRKDFIVDAYQIDETRALGADAMLLIVAALSHSELHDYYQIGTALGMTVLVECHDALELECALKLNPPLIGINNRNLKTFKTDIHTSIKLLKDIPKGITVISESGIVTKEDIDTLSAQGIHAFLIGESLMKEPSPGAALSKLLGESL